MSAQDEMAAPDTPGETEPQVAVEQEADVESYGDTLLKLAQSEGVATDDAPVPEEEPEDPETETEGEPEEKPEEEKAPEDETKIWPASAKARVAEETARKRRATERAEKAEALAAQLQAQLQQAVALPVTEDNPFNDIQNVNDLERLERSYEKAIDLANENAGDFGAENVLVGRDKNGEDIRRDFSKEELVAMKSKAEKAVRRQIPERKTYLQQRAVADAQAMAIYPDLKDPDTQFSKETAYIIYRVLSGQALKEPEVAIWAAHAVRGYHEALKRNGDKTSGVSAEGKKILQAAKQQIAPTPTRTRSIPERRGSVSLEKLNKEFEKAGTADAAEKLLAAMRLGEPRGTSRKLEPLAE